MAALLRRKSFFCLSFRQIKIGEGQRATDDILKIFDSPKKRFEIIGQKKKGKRKKAKDERSKTKDFYV